MTFAEMDVYLQTLKPDGMEVEEAPPTQKKPSSLANAAEKNLAPVW